MLYPVKYLRSLQRTLNKKEPKPTLTALNMPEIALLVLSHLDPSTILLIRLVSSSINTLILTHQRSISITVAQRQFSIIVTDFNSPDIGGLQENFHLKTIARLPKAYEMARRANSQCGRTAEIVPEISEAGKPTTSYPAFIARCARAILTIWVIGDIRRHITRPKLLPTYIPLLSRREKCARHLSRKTTGKPPFVSQTNRRAISQYIETLAPDFPTETQSQLAIFDDTRQTYLNSLPLDRRLDLVGVQHYLFLALAMVGLRYVNTSREQRAFALQQSPNFLLLLSSRDPDEWGWASRLMIEVTCHKVSGYLTREIKSEKQGARVIPIPLVEKDMIEESKRVKEGLTR